MSCDNCGNDQWLTDPSRGEMSCQSCGLTLDNAFAFSPSNEPKLAKKKWCNAELEDSVQLFEFNLSIQRRARVLLNTFASKSPNRVPPLYAALFALYLAQAELHGGLTLREMIARRPELDMVRLRTVRKRMLAVLPDCYNSVQDIIVLYCNSLDGPYYLAPMAERIYTVCQDYLVGREYETTATACITLAVEASQLDISRTDIATVALIAESTIDTVCRNIKRHLDPVLPPNQIELIKSVKVE